jgi:hypothetical protein
MGSGQILRPLDKAPVLGIGLELRSGSGLVLQLWLWSELG